MDKSWYSCDDKEVTDNAKQKCDKYLPFEYTPNQNWDYGSYKIIVLGIDKANNNSQRENVLLNIVPLSSFTTEEQKEIINEELKDLPEDDQKKIMEELDLTKSEENTTISDNQDIKTSNKIVGAFRNFWSYIKEVADYGVSSIGLGIKQPRQFLANMGDWLSYTTISFGEIVLDKEPTQISEVKVSQISSNSVVITWRTNHLSTSKVNFGETLDYGQDVQSSKKVHDHRVEVTNLKPSTRYYYEVMSLNKNYVYDAHHEFITLEQ